MPDVKVVALQRFDGDRSAYRHWALHSSFHSTIMITRGSRAQLLGTPSPRSCCTVVSLWSDRSILFDEPAVHTGSPVCNSRTIIHDRAQIGVSCPFSLALHREAFSAEDRLRNQGAFGLHSYSYSPSNVNSNSSELTSQDLNPAAMKLLSLLLFVAAVSAGPALWEACNTMCQQRLHICRASAVVGAGRYHKFPSRGIRNAHRYRRVRVRTSRACEQSSLLSRALHMQDRLRPAALCSDPLAQQATATPSSFVALYIPCPTAPLCSLCIPVHAFRQRPMGDITQFQTVVVSHA